ncbi:MAG: cytochrome c biogenesis protein CcsA [Candidatus Marinimicrobia bacterium]|nr:cytochrome c biogenesis protein CcsA [Candidatus Neomarinimicrobiota bacterium]
MTSFFTNKFNKSMLIALIILFMVDVYIIVTNTPMIPQQHWAQKIFYLHVPVAWTAFLSYFFVMVFGIMYLVKKDYRWDRLGQSAAEIGTLFTALVLTTGPIWAKPIWGKPWIWEPRLTTTLILFLVYIGYFMLREFGGHPERVARYAAILGIIAFVDVPIIFLSVKFWTPEIQSHPQVEMAQQPGGILGPFFFSLALFTINWLMMLRFRSHTLNIKQKLLSDHV